MEEISKKITITVQNFSELSEQERELFEHAARVRLNAQAPYSNFLVGVAILSEKDSIYVGCNVERCTWTQSSHAEQNAVDSMVAALGPSKIKKIVVIAAPKDRTIALPPQKKLDRVISGCMPCGHCLQIVWENCFGDPTVKILSLLQNGEVASATIGDVLPVRFGPENVGVKYEK